MNELHPASVEALQELEAETRHLYAVLIRERAVLRDRQWEKVLESTAEKTASLARVDDLWERLTGLPASKDIIPDWLADLTSTGPAEIQAVWAEIRHLARRCRELNESNGATIALLQEYNRKSLELVFGQRRQRVGYGADGQVQAEVGDRLLGAT
ncbi:flagella synthesis protein FlgN [Methylohalobius crimeensis]|uniref:flagella synthesis protein FlgN n=1 Tax=Methylohalobius crimeensis TaxID=244365 RepID=UPI0003B3B023|nr:flagellar protein FlgN [Methylohalobius crimeensis]